MAAQDASRMGRVAAHAKCIGNDARALSRELREGAGEMRVRMNLGQAIAEHPMRALLVAAGAGYILGGGLFTPMTRRLVRIGVRSLLVPIVTRQVEAMLQPLPETSQSTH
jgi:hypothetical protein